MGTAWSGSFREVLSVVRTLYYINGPRLGTVVAGLLDLGRSLASSTLAAEIDIHSGMRTVEDSLAAGGRRRVTVAPLADRSSAPWPSAGWAEPPSAVRQPSEGNNAAAPVSWGRRLKQDAPPPFSFLPVCRTGHEDPTWAPCSASR